jgi:hypothetical protein
MPERLWKRCMEFKMKTEAGKSETYYIDRATGTAHKVLFTCNRHFPNLFDSSCFVCKPIWEVIELAQKKMKTY